MQAGGDGRIATVASTDLAVIQWEILSPVEVIISSSRLYGDYEPLDLDENIRDLIDGHALGARAQLEVRNHLPLGIEARLLFSPDTTTIKTAPLMTVGPVTLAAGLGLNVGFWRLDVAALARGGLGEDAAKGLGVGASTQFVF